MIVIQGILLSSYLSSTIRMSKTIKPNRSYGSKNECDFLRGKERISFDKKGLIHQKDQHIQKNPRRNKDIPFGMETQHNIIG